MLYYGGEYVEKSVDSSAITCELFFTTIQFSDIQRSFKYIKDKDKLFHAHDMKAYKETGDIAVPILNRGSMWS
jgi:hypothetical protein